jgi:hypothetical protein
VLLGFGEKILLLLTSGRVFGLLENLPLKFLLQQPTGWRHQALVKWNISLLPGVAVQVVDQILLTTLVVAVAVLVVL